MENKEKLNEIRHSLAHLLAKAVIELYPGAENAIGPSIENGFYQDFEIPVVVSDKDLKKIENKMREILKTWHQSKRKEVTKEEALEEFKWNKYKTELIQEFAESGKTITFYILGDFIDLCRGGHAENADDINPEGFKLTRVAGAYWKGDEKNKMLTRIYGVAFETKQELDSHLEMLEEAKRRDHRKIGKELDLFTFSDLVGPGLPLWTPRGTAMRIELDNFVWSLRKKRGYQKVEIPHITKRALYETSGHWQKFGNELFRVISREGGEYALKPMNCPHHTQIYNHLLRSYRELPQRYANTTMVYRDEQSGELSGLSRVLSITQDDAHVFCRKNQLKEEFLKIWDIVEEFYSRFGFSLKIRLSFHDPKNLNAYLGTPEIWQEAENTLKEIVEIKKADYFIAEGEAALYGPKIDFMGKDSLGRDHQVATIQLDMNLPERFDLFCINENNEKERIVIIHAAIMGSIERFLSVIIEHFAGSFPFWLAPEQIRILPISEKFNDYSKDIQNKLFSKDFRVSMDDSDNTLGKKIREGKKMKIPYLIVVGESENSSQTITIEPREGESQKNISLDKFITDITVELQK